MRLTPPQLKVLAAAWMQKVFERNNLDAPYHWDVLNGSQCTPQITALKKLGLVTVVPLPRNYGLNSKLVLPTADGEDILKEKGIITDDQ